MSEVHSLAKFSLQSPASEIKTQFEEEGFVVFEDLLGQEVRETRNQIREVLEAEAKRHLETHSGERFDTFLIDLFEISDEYQDNLYRLLQDLSNLHAIASHPKMFRIMEIVGISTPAFRDTGLRMHPPNEDRILKPPHQDMWLIRSPNCINFWIPLVDLSEDLSPLRVWPRSHQQGPIPKEDKYVDENGHKVLPESAFEDYEEKILLLDAGDVLAFDHRLIHASTPNTASKTRWAQTLRFDDATDVDWLIEGENPWREYQPEELR